MKKNVIKKVVSALFAVSAAMSLGTMTLAAEAAAAPAGNSGNIMSLVIFAGLIVLMYFLMIRPQRKREKETAEMRNSIKPGDKVVTIGGIVGKVCSVKDDVVTIETGADKVRIKFVKYAISSVEKPKVDKVDKVEKKTEEKTEEPKAE